MQLQYRKRARESVQDRRRYNCCKHRLLHHYRIATTIKRAREKLADAQQSAHRSLTRYPVATILIALLFIILLWKENVKQREVIAQQRSTLAASLGTRAGPPYAQKGDVVPAFEAVSLGGRATKIAFDEHSRWLLFIFSSQCDACISQVPTWNLIVQEVKNPRCKAIGMLTDATPLAIPELKFDVLPMPDMSLQRAYRVVAVPLVMVISESGKIEWVK